MTDKRPVGKPPFYANVEELEARIDQYFKNCPHTRTMIFRDKLGMVHEHEVPAPTISGLALHLGFLNRASMYDYESKPEYTNTIKRAKAFMEMEYEKQLSCNPTGAIFALKNFGWTDKQENLNTHQFEKDASIQINILSNDNKQHSSVSEELSE